MSEGPPVPNWPNDILYLPVASARAPDPKAPDTAALPGTWSYDGEGCVTYEELEGDRWAIVDVDVDGWRLLIVDLDIYKADDPDEDLTHDDRDRILEGLDAAPETRIHESQSGGLHVFYWVRTDQLTDDGKAPASFYTGIDEKLNGYVLSDRCEGYTVAEDVEPSVLDDFDDLPEQWLSDDNDEINWEDVRRKSSTGRSSKDASVYDLLPRSSFPPDTRVTHPFHKSSTTSNFMVDSGGETFRCWRHKVTGDAIHLVGIDEGIIECGEWKHGRISDEKYSRILEAAEKRGIIEPSHPSPEQRREDLEIVEDRDTYESIDDVEFDDRDFVLTKAPREGGSYGVHQFLVNTGDDILTVVPRHSIAEQHVDTVGRMLPSVDAAVHYVGASRACNNPGGNCPNVPQDHHDRMNLRDRVRDITTRKQSVTVDDAPDDVCPASFIRMAAELGRVTITVPDLFYRFCDNRGDLDDPDDIDDMQLFMDEEQGLSYFWPGSVTVADISTEYDADRTRSLEQRNRAIKTEFAMIERIWEDVQEDQEERRESEGGFSRTPFEILVEETVHALWQVMEAINTDHLVEEIEKRDKAKTVGNAVEIAEEELAEVDLPGTNASKDRMFRTINDRCEDYLWDDQANPSNLLTVMAFPAEDHPFDFKRKAGGNYTLRIIGEKEQEPFHADLLREFDQIAIVAGPEGERFFDELGIDDPRSIGIGEFNYADDYIVFPLGAETEDGMETVPKQRRRVKGAVRDLNTRSKPQIAVTGTKERANEIRNSLSDGSADTIESPTVPEVNLSEAWTTGDTAVIYENSVVSRGIDAPLFDITAICETGFATPYWEAKGRQAEEGDEKRRARSRETELKARELTNAALRSAPTRYAEDKLGTKFIIVSDYDADDLLYLQDRRLDTFEDEETVTRIVDTLTVGGDYHREAMQVRDAVRSAREYNEIVLTESLNQSLRPRPEYDMTTIESMIEDGFPEQDTIEAVLETVETFEGDPTTKQVVDSTPIRDETVLDILNLLEATGELSSYSDKSGRGQPPIRFSTKP